MKKILPIALGVAAIVYTGGAALGLTGTWGAAVSSLTSQMGATGLLGKVLTGAVTQAGYGAAVGGLVAGVTGGDVMKGMRGGALTGAITGGATGGLGFNTDPLSGMNGEAAAGAPGGAPNGAAAPLADVAASDLAVGPLADGPGLELGPSGPRAMFQAPAAGATAPAGAAPAPAGRGLLSAFDEGGWVERNGSLVGHTVSGIGKGLIDGMSAGDAGDAALKRERERQAFITGNYSGSGRGLLTGPSTAGGAQVARPTPTQRFDPASYGGEYIFDPAAGRIVFVAAG